MGNQSSMPVDNSIECAYPKSRCAVQWADPLDLEYRADYGLLLTLRQFREWLKQPTPHLGLSGVSYTTFEVVKNGDIYSVTATQEEMTKIMDLHNHPLNLVVRFTCEEEPKIFLGFDIVMDRWCECDRTEEEQLSVMNSFRVRELIGYPRDLNHQPLTTHIVDGCVERYPEWMRW